MELRTTQLAKDIMPKKQTARDFLDRFERDCRKRFKFLEEEFGFKPPKRQRMSVFCSLTYQNETTAVEVSLEPTEGGVFVLVSRLLNGEISKYPIFVTRKATLHSFYLDDLVRLRRPDAARRQASLDLVSGREIAKSLAERSPTARPCRRYPEGRLCGVFGIGEDRESSLTQLNHS